MVGTSSGSGAASVSRNVGFKGESAWTATCCFLTIDPPRPVFKCASDAACSSDSSSPENIEDSGLDSPSHPTLGPSPEPAGWAAWPSASQSNEAALGRPVDPFLPAFRDPSPVRSPHPQNKPASVWSAAASRPSRVSLDTDLSARFPSFSQAAPPPGMESVWSSKHAPPEDPFLSAFERSVTQEALTFADAWPHPPPRQTQEGRATEARGDPFAMTLPTSSSSSASSTSNRKDRDRKRERSLPPPASSDDPFAITMIGSPTHQSSLASRLGLDAGAVSLTTAQPKTEPMHWSSVHNPFSEGAGGKGGERRKPRSSESEPRRNAPPLTRHSGPQEDLCFSTDRDQDCLDLSTPASCTAASHKGTKLRSSSAVEPALFFLSCVEAPNTASDRTPLTWPPPRRRGQPGLRGPRAASAAVTE